MYSLLTWVHEPFEKEIVYYSDWGGYSISCNSTNWELFDHNGRVIKSFDSLADAQNHAEYLYENQQ